MTKTGIRRVISLMLLLSMLAGISAAASIYGLQARAHDPFAEMHDGHIHGGDSQTKNVAGHGDSGNPESRSSAATETDMRGFGHTGSIDPRKTDRYIVKHRNGGAAAFERKLSERLLASSDIWAAEIRDGCGTFGIALGIGGKQRGMPVETPPAGGALRNMRVIVLTEPALPSEFAEELRALGADRDIEYIQPDFRLELSESGAPQPGGSGPGTAHPGAEPGEQERSGSPASPGRKVLVAVIDTGIDTGHGVFAGYLHRETPGTPTSSKSYAHGTHTAGIIAMTLKETGTDAELLPIRVFENGRAYTSDIIAAVHYAGSRGARVINCSFGGAAYNRALYEAFEENPALFTAAAGNSRRDAGESPSYPAGYNLPNVISAASVNADYGFSYYSNYGPVDIAARGRAVTSSLPGGGYGEMSGTSQSAAQVAGAAAAALSAEGRLTAPELRMRLITAADTLANLEGKVTGGKMLNIWNAVLGIPGTWLSPEAADDFDIHSQQRGGPWMSVPGNIIKIAAGSNHTLALKADGTVWAWGANGKGQLGTGSYAGSSVPLQVPGLTGIADIAVGNSTHSVDSEYSMALGEDGSVYFWGLFYDYNSYMHEDVPMQLHELENIAAVAAGRNMYALDPGGDLHMYGLKTLYTSYMYYEHDNTDGFEVIMEGVAAVDACERYTVILGEDGAVHQRFTGGWMELGYGLGNIEEIPELSGMGAAWIAGGHLAHAAGPGGILWTWGGAYPPYGIMEPPETEPGITGAAAADASDTHLLVLMDDGTVLERSYEGFTDPAAAAMLSGIARISAGNGYSFAIGHNGDIWAWGSNAYGQLGDGSEEDRDMPVLIFEGIAGAEPVTAEYEITAAAGAERTLALKAEVTVDFRYITYTLEYDPAELELLDLAAQTPGLDTAPGKITGTGLTIASHSGGVLVFTVDRGAANGSFWTGTLTLARFKALATGSTTISLTQRGG